MFSDRAGIYHITHVKSGRMYIGSTTNIESRLRNHFYKLRKGTHPNPKLQNCFNKHGEGAFSFGVLDYVEDVEELISWEQQWIDTAKPWFNIRKIAHSNLGLTYSDEVRARMSVIRKECYKNGQVCYWKGKKLPVETKLKMSIKRKGLNTWSKGRKLSEEHKMKMSRAKKGKVLTKEQRENISRAKKGKSNGLEGRVMPEEQKKKIADAQRGRVGTFKGRKHTEETLEKMSRAQSNRSEETRRKLSESKTGTKYKMKPRESKITCSRGHLYTVETTYINSKGYQECKICRSENNKHSRAVRQSAQQQ